MVDPLHNNADELVAIATAYRAAMAARGVVTALSPTTAMADAPDVTLHVLGTGFPASAVVLVNGSEQATIVVSPTELTCLLRLSVLRPGMIEITVSTATGPARGAVDFQARQKVTLVTDPAHLGLWLLGKTGPILFSSVQDPLHRSLWPVDPLQSSLTPDPVNAGLYVAA